MNEDKTIILDKLVNKCIKNLPEFVNYTNIVYCCKNKINGKCYIGETKLSLRERWLMHKSQMFSSRKITMAIYDAIKKYGMENFEISILNQGFSSDEERKENEKYWISKLNTFVDSSNSSGYNLTIGGKCESKYSSNVVEKRNETCIKKYGYLPINSKESRKKALETNRKNHGGILAFQSKISREKGRKTQKEKYGMLAMHLPENKEKAKKSLKEKYGKVLPFNTKESIEKAQKVAPLYRIIGNINRHIFILKEKNLEINSKNYIFNTDDKKRMWQQHIPNVLKNIEKLRTLDKWTIEMENIFSNIDYDNDKIGINKILFKNEY